MPRTQANLLILTLSIFTMTYSTAARAVGIDFVTVGGANNAADATGYGAVNYAYDIGKYEITAGQYAEFLNAVAPTDNYGLYSNMATSSYYLSCNILRTGASGSYQYSVAPDWANRPVSGVSWDDAARFCNWLQNGQKTYAVDPLTTEHGSYALNGVTDPNSLLTVTRNPNAQYFIPTENEWYKAAYYDPNKGGQGVNGYWLYPTKSDTAPSNTVSSTGTNNADFILNNGNWSLGDPYYRTEVGTFADSASAYGTFDQGGNVRELNEGVVGSSRGVRGGSMDYIVDKLASTYREDAPNYDSANVGFRIVQVPEPSTIVLLLLSLVAGVMTWMRLDTKN